MPNHAQTIMTNMRFMPFFDNFVLDEHKNNTIILHTKNKNIQIAILPIVIAENREKWNEEYKEGNIFSILSNFCDIYKNKKEKLSKVSLFYCGVYGTRTRDPMRDRHVF